MYYPLQVLTHASTKQAGQNVLFIDVHLGNDHGAMANGQQKDPDLLYNSLKTAEGTGPLELME